MKKRYISLIAVIVVILSTVGMILLVNKNNADNTIPDNYIVIFKGETGETVHTTYLYRKEKIKTLDDGTTETKVTWKYINTESTLGGYDSVNWTEKVIKKGKLKKRKDIFKKAKKNGATSYVKYMKNGKVYTYDAFKKRWS